MRKLITILIMIGTVMTGWSQTRCKENTTTTIASSIDVDLLSGTDTTVYFYIPNLTHYHPYSINVIPTDSIKTATVYAVLKASNDTSSNYFAPIADTMSFTALTKQGNFFSGLAFPYRRGAVTIVKNGSTNAVFKIIITVN